MQAARLMVHAPISTKLPSFTVRQGIRPVVVRRLRSARRRSCQMAEFFAGGYWRAGSGFWGPRKQPVVLASSSRCQHQVGLEESMFKTIRGHCNAQLLPPLPLQGQTPATSIH